MPAWLIPAAMSLGSALLGGGKGQQSQSTYDPALGKYLDIVRQLGLGQFAGMGERPQMDPSLLSAIQALTQMQGGGLDAMQMILGNKSAAGAMNPYNQAMQPIFDRMAQRAQLAARQQSTMVGQTPGTAGRASLMQGQALQGVGEQQAQFGYQGWQDTMNRLMALAGLGGQASGQLGGIGEWSTMLPMEWAQGRMGLLGPGLTSAGSTTSQQTGGSIWERMLGGGLAGYALGKGFGNTGQTDAAAHGPGR